MTNDRAEAIIEELALHDADLENPTPSDFELGQAIKVLGLPDAYDHYASAVDNMVVVDDEESEDDED